MELENFPDRSPSLLTATSFRATSLRASRHPSLTASGTPLLTSNSTFQDVFASREELFQLTEPGLADEVTHGADQDAEIFMDTAEPKSSLGYRVSARFWWVEALCCLLSIGAMVAVAAILRTYNLHPLPDWPRQITINSLVSIFVILLKTPMLLVIAEGMLVL